MAPKKARDAGGASAGGGAGGRRKPQAAQDDDDKFLARQSQARWTDSFIVLCLMRWAVGRLIDFLRSRWSGNAPGAGAAKKKVEKVDPKEAALQFLSDFKIPVGLTAIFVLTCAIIAGGESFGTREERPREAIDDYYGTLGIPRDAENADVKRAYKTLAKRWHPDRNPNCSSCQETFAKIAVAYETLSDDKKRAAYDESGDVASSELKSPRSVPLTRDNFDELVTFSNDVWIVQIFKPHDGNCHQFHPFWENQIQKHGHLVRFGRIDITNDQAKWLPVKIRVLPLVLKFGRHLGQPEIFPITAMHETPQTLMKFVLTSFPNIGLPLHTDNWGLQRWLGSSTRRHKVLFTIPGRSEEERYKSHLVPRKLAARWSEIFEFRTAETAALHKLPAEMLPVEVRSKLPSADQSAEQAAVFLFPAEGGATAPRAHAVFQWPTGEEELVLQLLSLAELVGPTLSARSAELLCRSLAIRRVYCLVLLDPADNAVARTTKELRDSRQQYSSEVAEIRAGGGEVTEDEDNFVVPALRLFRQPRGLQPSVVSCHAPKFAQVEKVLGGSGAFLMDLDTGRVAALKGLSSFRGLYPQIAYEDSLTWVEDVLHPFLSLPDCEEGMLEHCVRSLRGAPVWQWLVQLLAALFVAEALAKAAVEQSLRWSAGGFGLLLVALLQSPPFLRRAAAWLPGALFAPPMLEL